MQKTPKCFEEAEKKEDATALSSMREIYSIKIGTDRKWYHVSAGCITLVLWMWFIHTEKSAIATEVISSSVIVFMVIFLRILGVEDLGSHPLDRKTN